MKLRRFISLSLMLCLFVILTSSVILYIVPQGRVAYWAEWKLFGLTKSQWGALHTNTGLLMLIVGGFHLYFNWRPITGYLKNKARQIRVFTPSFSLALGVMTAFVVLTIAGAPPMVWMQDLRAHIEEGEADRLGEPPYGHAEESSLRIFLRNVALDPQVAKDNLAAAGIEVDDPEVTVLELAGRNGLSPQELYEIMKGPEESRSTDPVPIPESMPQGTGRWSLNAFCEEYNRDPGVAVEILTAAGWTVDPEASLKDTATANGGEALDLLDLLRAGFADRRTGP